MKTGRSITPAYRKLIDWHVASGTAAIVAVGTTGESPTVDVDEHCELIRVAVEQTAGRIPVIAGTGGNSTREAIELTAFAKKAGASSSLQVVPYYNKPTQEGLYRHFRAVTEAVDLPIIVYNVPGRTVADLANDTVARLAELPLVIGIKDATGDIPRGSDLIGRLPSRFAIYSGNDDSALALMANGRSRRHLGGGQSRAGANGANVRSRRWAATGIVPAQSIKSLLPLHLKLFVEANPIPVEMGNAADGPRRAGHSTADDAAVRRQSGNSSERLARGRYHGGFTMNGLQRRLSVTLLGVAALGGCAVADGLNERSRIDYKSATPAKTGPSLEVPPDLSNPRNDEPLCIARSGHRDDCFGALIAIAQRPSR